MLYCNNIPKSQVTPPYSEFRNLVPPMVRHNLTKTTKQIYDNCGSSHVLLPLFKFEFSSLKFWHEVGVDFVLC